MLRVFPDRSRSQNRIFAVTSSVEPMAEMAGYDKGRTSDGIHSRSEIEPEPGALEQAIVAVLHELVLADDRTLSR